MNKLLLIQFLVVLVVISVLYHDVAAFKMTKKKLKKLAGKAALKSSKKVVPFAKGSPQQSVAAPAEPAPYFQAPAQTYYSAPTVVAPVQSAPVAEVDRPSRRPGKKVVGGKKKKFPKKKKFGFKKFFG